MLFQEYIDQLDSLNEPETLDNLNYSEAMITQLVNMIQTAQETNTAEVTTQTKAILINYRLK